MFLVNYIESMNSSGDGDLRQKSKTFMALEPAQKFIEDHATRADFSNMQIFVPLGQENLDYKEKFEELYNHVLLNAGIRQPEPKEKSETIVK